MEKQRAYIAIDLKSFYVSVECIQRGLDPRHTFTGTSFDDNELKTHPELSIDYVIAPPQMALYMETSARIYEVYLKYVAPEDIHVYSIDEVFIDATAYLGTSTPREFAMKIILDVLATTSITATAGIGPNLYLCKVAMDIWAKHQVILTVGYDMENLTDPKRNQAYKGPVTTDHYGRKIPKHTHSTENLGKYTSSEFYHPIVAYVIWC